MGGGTADILLTCQELQGRELISKQKMEELSTMLGPNPVVTGCGPHSPALAKEASRLQSDPAVMGALMAEVGLMPYGKKVAVL